VSWKRDLAVRPVSGTEVLALGLLLLGGFLIGGVISFARARRWVPMVVVALLAALAIAAAVLRLLPT
jgi:CHASE2 domain-containing sensor protein